MLGRKDLIVAIVAVLLSLFLLMYYTKSYKSLFKQSTVNNQTILQTPTSSISASLNGQTVVLSSAEVAKHSSSADCWFIVEGSVYDVTSYAVKHPGGAARIMNYCGKDATTAYVTQDGRGSHSSAAYQELQSLFIGKLNDTISQNTVSETQKNIQIKVSQIPQRKGEDDDD